MTIFFEIVLGLIIVGVVVLSFPVRFRLLVSGKQKVFQLRIFFQKIDYKLDGKTDKVAESQPKQKSKSTIKVKTKTDHEEDDEFPWFSFLLSERSTVLHLIKHLFRAIGRLLRIPKWDILRFHWQIGGDDPALIGFISGLCWAVTPFVPSRFQFTFEPDFTAGKWDWEGEVQVHIIPLFVVGWFCLELVRFPWLRVIGVCWRMRHYHTVESPEFA